MHRLIDLSRFSLITFQPTRSLVSPDAESPTLESGKRLSVNAVSCNISLLLRGQSMTPATGTQTGFH